MNEFETVWAALPEATRSWLIDHNGERLPETVVQQLIDAAGGTAPDWLDPTGEDGPVLVDAVVDWIEVGPTTSDVPVAQEIELPDPVTSQ